MRKDAHVRVCLCVCAFIYAHEATLYFWHRGGALHYLSRLAGDHDILTRSCTIASSAAPRFLGSGGALAGHTLMKGDQAEASPIFSCSITAMASCTFHGRQRHHPGGSPGNGQDPLSSPTVVRVHASGTCAGKHRQQ